MGTAFFSLVMLLVYALLDRLDVRSYWGRFGCRRGGPQLFLMALSVQRAAESMKGVTVPPEPLEETAIRIRRPASASRAAGGAAPSAGCSCPGPGRMLLLVGGAIVALTAPCFHPVAAAPPLLFPRLVIFLRGFVKPKNKRGLNADET